MAVTLPLYPLINGSRYDFSMVEINVNGLVMQGIKEISYKNALEPGEVMGTSAQKLGRTRGQYKPEASFTMYKQDFSFFVQALGDGYMEQSFDVTVTYNDNNNNICTDKIVGARVKSHEDSATGGNDVLAVKVELDIMGLTYNGQKPIKNMIGITAL